MSASATMAGRLMPVMGTLEFANREMADMAYLPELAAQHTIAAGVVDVKSFHEETDDEVADRIRKVHEHVPAEKLHITADCGFSTIPRWLARKKLAATAGGAKIVQHELGP